MTTDGAIDFEPDFDPGLAPASGRDEPPGRAPRMSDERGLSDPAPPSGGQRFDGPVEFAAALRTRLAHAVEQAARRICWCDDDFSTWPLGETEWLAPLTRWARLGGRELVMIARDYTVIERLHPRFAGWRRDFAHVVQCIVPEQARVAALPTLWIDSTDQALRVFDREHWRGRAGFDRIDRQRAREEFDAITQRGSPGFATSTLGL